MLETARIPVHRFTCLCPSVNCKWSSVCIKQSGILTAPYVLTQSVFSYCLCHMVLTSFRFPS